VTGSELMVVTMEGSSVVNKLSDSSVLKQELQRFWDTRDNNCYYWYPVIIVLGMAQVWAWLTNQHHPKPASIFNGVVLID